MSLEEIVNRIEVLVRALLNSVLSIYAKTSDLFSGRHTDLIDITGTLTHQQIDAALAAITAPTAQIQSDWTQTDTALLDFIKNKPESVDQVQVDWDAVSGIPMILHKPTIPAGQIQADWGQADNTILDFIKNKPNIPADQVQADWAQSDSSQVSFILNKPDLSGGGGVGGGTQVQSDWNQTDVTQVSFINNKPVLTSSDGSITIDGFDIVINTNKPCLAIDITLPVAASVANRIAGAVEVTDYPLGWILAAGINPNDLVITHGLGRRISLITVFYLDIDPLTGLTTQERQLLSTAAYTGLAAPDQNTLKIEGLATIAYPIIIHCIFT